MMDDKTKDQVSSFFGTVRIEGIKLWQSARLKLDTATLKKRKEEKLKSLARKVLQLAESGDIDADLLEPEYSAILEIDAELGQKHDELSQIRQADASEIARHDSKYHTAGEEPAEKKAAPKKAPAAKKPVKPAAKKPAAKRAPKKAAETAPAETNEEQIEEQIKELVQSAAETAGQE